MGRGSAPEAAPTSTRADHGHEGWKQFDHQESHRRESIRAPIARVSTRSGLAHGAPGEFARAPDPRQRFQGTDEGSIAASPAGAPSGATPVRARFMHQATRSACRSSGRPSPTTNCQPPALPLWNRSSTLFRRPVKLTGSLLADQEVDAGRCCISPNPVASQRRRWTPAQSAKPAADSRTCDADPVRPCPDPCSAPRTCS